MWWYSVARRSLVGLQGNDDEPLLHSLHLVPFPVSLIALEREILQLPSLGFKTV